MFGESKKGYGDVVGMFGKPKKAGEVVVGAFGEPKKGCGDGVGMFGKPKKAGGVVV